MAGVAFDGPTPESRLELKKIENRSRSRARGVGREARGESRMEGVRPWRPSWARLSWNDCEEGEPKHYLLSVNDLIAAAQPPAAGVGAAEEDG